MRTNIVTTIVIAMLLFIFSPDRLLAGDTLVVSASGANLDVIINNDVTGGRQAHKVYQLVDVDLTYLYTGQISPLSDITIIGKLGPDGRPPCIQPGLTGNNQIPAILFNLTKNGTKFLMKNLYIEDFAVNGSRVHPGRDFLVAGDSVSVYVDNVVFDGNDGSVFAYTGNAGNYFITNCKFKNGIDPVCWTDAEMVAPVWPANPSVDTISFKYCTFLCINSYLAAPGAVVRYVDFSHNSVIYSFLQPLWIFAANSAKVNNNIFYSPFIGGELVAEYPWWDEMFSPEYPAIISFDTMSVDCDTVFDLADKGKPNWRMLAEANRNIEVKNNLYFQATAVTDFWTDWNKTHTGDDSLYTPTWMNARTTNMFNDKTHWPGLVQSGNIMNQDPGYGPSFANILKGGGEYGLGLLEYFNEIRGAKAPTLPWGYQLPAITSGSNWIPVWPLPESADMQYSNTALKTAGTDGLPVGDPGWFTNGYTGIAKNSVITPKTFSLANAYPNPFNPTTNIKFSVSKSENVTLVVFNILGQQVRTLVNGLMKAGDYSATWDGKDEFGKSVPSGIYLYRLESQSFSSTKKMMLMK